MQERVYFVGIEQKQFAPPIVITGVGPNPVFPEASLIPVNPPFLGTNLVIFSLKAKAYLKKKTV